MIVLTFHTQNKDLSQVNLYTKRDAIVDKKSDMKWSISFIQYSIKHKIHANTVI